MFIYLRPELGTFEWYISGLMLDPLFLKIEDIYIYSILSQNLTKCFFK